MLIKVAKVDLQDALQAVSSSMATSAGDISSHFLFRAIEGVTDKAEVLTSSGRLFGACPFIATVEIDEDQELNAFTIEGKRLKQWVKATQDTVLTFTYDPDDKIVSAKTERGTQQFRSLDPSKFPFYDEVFDVAEDKTTIPTVDLVEALNYTKQFVADISYETTSPSHCVTEMRDGSLLASDKRAFCQVVMKGIEKCTVRVFVADIRPLLAFLSKASDNVQILEYDKGQIFKRDDGAFFGAAKIHVAFPSMSLPLTGDDQFWFEVDKEDLKAASLFLLAGADEKDDKLYIRREDKSIVFGMDALTKNRQEITTKATIGQLNDADDFPSFSIPIDCLRKVVEAWDSDMVRFGVNKRGTKGYVRFFETRERSKFWTVMMWR